MRNNFLKNRNKRFAGFLLITLNYETHPSIHPLL